MKDLKYTLKAIVKHPEGAKAVWRSWLRILWLPYSSLALAKGLCALCFTKIACDTILPVVIYGRSAGSYSRVLSIVGVDIVVLSLFVVFLILAILAAFKAHKAMRRVVKKYELRELSRNRKNLLYVENTFILLTTMLVAFMPPLVIFFSALAAARSGMLLEQTPMPTWIACTFVATMFVGTLLLEAVLTLVRLTFREISPLTTSPAEENIETNETENNTDGALAADSHNGNGFATTAQND